MTPEELIRRQMELELGVPVVGTEIPVTPANSGEVPRLTIARYAGGSLRFYRSDLAPEVRQRLELSDDAELGGAVQPGALLGGDPPKACRWYVVRSVPAQIATVEVVWRDGRFIVERDGREVASAWSERLDSGAAEVEVATLLEYRRQGFGRLVVAAWARWVLEAGLIGFYSHRIENEASAALARSLELVPYAETFEFP